MLDKKQRPGLPVGGKRTQKISPAEVVNVDPVDDLVKQLKEASILSRLNERPVERFDPCRVGCDCPPCRRGDCNRGIVCMGGSRSRRSDAYGMPYGRY